MAQCPNNTTCPFLSSRMAGKYPNIVDLMKQRYCERDSSGCARLAVSTQLGGEAVPPDLAPNDFARARSLLAAARRRSIGV
ncbi:MAG: hypothetical protein QM765_29905 [Myxococcales bacterium]